MKLKVVSFELAKKLKELGLDEPVDSWYRKGGTISDGKGFMSYLDMYKAPTLELVRMWFREKYNINIVIFYTAYELSWRYKVVELRLNGSDHINRIDYHTYEQALEAGLLRACELISNN